MEETYKINFAAPDLVNVCIDRWSENGCEGRLYCGYYPQAVVFHDEYGMIKIMEELMDSIDYPQASTIMRCYDQKNVPKKCEKERIFSGPEIMKEKGKLATFVIYVQYRQNSTWQGEFFWAEGNLVKKFRSVLELLKLTDKIIEYSRNSRFSNRTTDYIYRIHKKEGGVGA